MKKNSLSKIGKYTTAALLALMLAAATTYRGIDFANSGISLNTEKLTQTVRKKLERKWKDDGKEDRLDSTAVTPTGGKTIETDTQWEWQSTAGLPGVAFEKAVKQETETSFKITAPYEYAPKFGASPEEVKAKDASDIEALAESIQLTLGNIQDMEGIADSLEKKTNPVLDFLKSTEALPLPIHIKNIKVIGHASNEAENTLSKTADPRNEKIAKERSEDGAQKIKAALTSIGIEVENIDFEITSQQDIWSAQQIDFLKNTADSLGFSSVYKLIAAYNEGEISDPKLEALIGKSRSVEFIVTLDSGIEVKYTVRIPLGLLLLPGMVALIFSRLRKLKKKPKENKKTPPSKPQPSLDDLAEKDRYRETKEEMSDDIDKTVKELTRRVKNPEMHRVVLSVDVSGSRGDFNKNANVYKSMVYAGEVLTRLGVPFQITVWAEGTKHIKLFDTPYDERVKAALASIQKPLEFNVGERTNFTQAFNQIASKLQIGNNFRKFIVVHTDGESSEHDGDVNQAIAHTRAVGAEHIGMDSGDGKLKKFMPSFEGVTPKNIKSTTRALLEHVFPKEKISFDTTTEAQGYLDNGRFSKEEIEQHIVELVKKHFTNNSYDQDWQIYYTKEWIKSGLISKEKLCAYLEPTIFAFTNQNFKNSYSQESQIYYAQEWIKSGFISKEKLCAYLEPTIFAFTKQYFNDNNVNESQIFYTKEWIKSGLISTEKMKQYLQNYPRIANNI